MTRTLLWVMVLEVHKHDFAEGHVPLQLMAECRRVCFVMGESSGLPITAYCFFFYVGNHLLNQ